MWLSPNQKIIIIVRKSRILQAYPAVGSHGVLSLRSNNLSVKIRTYELGIYLNSLPTLYSGNWVKMSVKISDEENVAWRCEATFLRPYN